MKTFLGVVLANYVLRLALAAALALPFARVAGASGLDQFPAGDRLLFESSGLYLLEVLRLVGPELAALGDGTLRLLVAAAAVLLVARALTLCALVAPRFELGAVVERGLRLVPSFLLIAGLTLLAQVVSFLVLVSIGARLSEWLGQSSEPRGDLTFAGVFLLAAVVAACLGAVAELARATLVVDGGAALSGIKRAFRLVRRFPGRALLRWAGFSSAGLVLAVLVAPLSEWLDVSRPGAWRVFAVFALHQVVVLALVALHTAWLRAALGLAQEPAASR